MQMRCDTSKLPLHSHSRWFALLPPSSFLSSRHYFMGNETTRPSLFSPTHTDTHTTHTHACRTKYPHFFPLLHTHPLLLPQQPSLGSYNFSHTNHKAEKNRNDNLCLPALPSPDKPTGYASSAFFTRRSRYFAGLRSEGIFGEEIAPWLPLGGRTSERENETPPPPGLIIPPEL